jgi:hypothetical protein
MPPRIWKRAGQRTIGIPTLRELYDLVCNFPEAVSPPCSSLRMALQRNIARPSAVTVTTASAWSMVANIAHEDERDGLKPPAP